MGSQAGLSLKLSFSAGNDTCMLNRVPIGPFQYIKNRTWFDPRLRGMKQKKFIIHPLTLM